MKNGISVYSDLNRFKKNFRLISCTLLKNSAKYGCITNMHNHSGQGARILGIRPFKAKNLHGASKPKKHSLLSKYLLSNPTPLPLLFLLFMHIFTSLKE
jgi:hypothetical protein